VNERDRKRHLVLLGGGHAHLHLLKRLAVEAPRGWAVTLVSPHPRQIYSGMLPGWVAGHYAIDACAISLSGLADRARIAFVQTAATGLDLAQNLVHCAEGQRLPFDIVSIDTGPEPALGDLPGAAEHALPVRPIEGFVAAWPAVADRLRGRAAPFEFVVIGGGAAAVELACAVRHRATLEGAADVRITLAAREPEPFASAAPGVRREVMRALRQRGITWRGERVASEVLADHVRFASGTSLPFDACLIASGAAAPRWPAAAGLATDAGGFIRVDRTLRSVSHPHVFAAGDVAAYADARPKSGVFAVRAGAPLAANLLAACHHAPLKAWHPQRRALYLVSTGDCRAIAAWGAWSAGGTWAWWWKDRIDRGFVQRYRE
jgi:pyridine nucleotide-disulfide oxidoreductase family protein